MSNDQGTPPGWYPDPGGTPARRWWNGTEWGDLEGSALGMPPTRKRRWPWIVGGVVVLIIVIAAVASGGDDDEGDDVVADTEPETTEPTEPESTTQPDTAPETTAAPTTEPPTTTTTEPPTTTTAAPEVGTRENPIPLGQVQRVGGWNLRVVGFTENANDAVAQANRFNDPPPDGEQYVLTLVEATYDGEDPSQAIFIQISFAYLGASNVKVDALSDRNCGVVEGDETEFQEVFVGGTITVPVCYALTPEDVATMVLSAEEAFSLDPDDHPWYFAVR